MGSLLGLRIALVRILWNADGIYGSPCIKALQDDLAYDVDLAATVNVKYVDYFS